MTKKSSKISKSSATKTATTKQPAAAKSAKGAAPPASGTEAAKGAEATRKVAPRAAGRGPAAIQVAPNNGGPAKGHDARAEARGTAPAASAAPGPAAAHAEVPPADRPSRQAERDARLPAVGTVLVKRDRLGRPQCECAIEEGGFRYKGTLHRSLSAAASAAAADLGSHSHVNGFVWWGLAKAARPAKDPSESLRKIAGRYEEQAAALLKQNTVAEARSGLRREMEAHVAHLTELIAKSAA